MSLGLVAIFQPSPSLDAEVGAALGVSGPSFNDGGSVEIDGCTLQFVVSGVEQTAPSRAKLKAIFDAATRQLTLVEGHGDDWAAMWRVAIALARAGHGLVFDPQDGVWLTPDEADARQNPTDELNEDSPEAQAVYARLAERFDAGLAGGPAGVHIEFAGSSTSADLLLQFALVAAAQVDEGDAFTFAVNTPLRLLWGALTVDEAKAIAQDLSELGIEAEAVADVKASKLKGKQVP